MADGLAEGIIWEMAGSGVGVLLIAAFLLGFALWEKRPQSSRHEDS